MKITYKSDIFSPAFKISDGGLVIRSGVQFDKSPFNPFVLLPKELAPGVDYSIFEEEGQLVAATARIPGEVGGFHVGLDGKIVEASIWDQLFRPSCADPRGMVFVKPGFWADIYLTAEDGTSRAGAKLARNISCWEASALLAAQGKTLLSPLEFALATEGVEKNKTAGSRPEVTEHIAGLRSTAGLEQATGTLWTWGRDIDPGSDTAPVMGGSWRSSDAGPRQLSAGGAGSSLDNIGARGRCDHLLLA